MVGKDVKRQQEKYEIKCLKSREGGEKSVHLECYWWMSKQQFSPNRAIDIDAQLWQINDLFSPDWRFFFGLRAKCTQTNDEEEDEEVKKANNHQH